MTYWVRRRPRRHPAPARCPISGVENGGLGTAVSLGARVFRPAAAAGGGNNVAGLWPAAALSGLRRFAASPESGSEDPRTQRYPPVWALLSTATPTALLLLLTACTATPADPTTPQTTALWLFDEPAGLYPSHTLDDMSDNDMVLSLGLGAQVAPGHYGNALLLAPPLAPPLDVPPGRRETRALRSRPPAVRPRAAPWSP